MVVQAKIAPKCAPTCIIVWYSETSAILIKMCCMNINTYCYLIHHGWLKNNSYHHVWMLVWLSDRPSAQRTKGPWFKSQSCQTPAIKIHTRVVCGSVSSSASSHWLVQLKTSISWHWMSCKEEGSHPLHKPSHLLQQENGGKPGVVMHLHS